VRLLKYTYYIESEIEMHPSKGERREKTGRGRNHTKEAVLTIPFKEASSPDELTTVNLQKSVCFSLPLALAPQP